MNDYHSILKRTLAALPNDSVEMRLRVYAKARSMIREQFDADGAKASPGGESQALAERMRALEAAIARIEAERSDPEFSRPTASQPEQAHAPAAPSAPVSAPSAPSSPVAAPSAPAPQYPSAPAAPAPAPRESPQAQASPQAATLRSEPQGEARKGGSSAARWIGGMAALALIAILAAGLLYMQRAREATPSPATSQGALESEASRSAVPEALAPSAPASQTQTPPESDSAPQARAPTAASGDAQEKAEGQASPSGNRSAQAQDLSASLSPDSASEALAPSAPAPSTPTPSTPPPSSPAPSAPAPGAEQPSAPAGRGIPSASGFEAEFPVISEEAFLYELRASQDGEPNPLALRSQGNVVWSLRRPDPPGASASGTSPSGASPSGASPSGADSSEASLSGASPSAGHVEIRGIMEIPTRQLRLELGIRRNSDPALSASHVIELTFSSLPDPLPIRVGELARFVMKADEQDRGESLIAVPVRIDANHFMIALNNLPQARSSNERLLFEREWIDVPMIYEDETRALVTLRKGRSGSEVFRIAFEEWSEL